MRTDLLDLPVHCVVCQGVVPTDRARRRSITCSPEHQELRKQAIRAMADKGRCRYCLKPSTLEQRHAFRVFANVQRKAAKSAALLTVVRMLQGETNGGAALGLTPKDVKEVLELLGNLRNVQPDREEVEDATPTEAEPAPANA